MAKDRETRKFEKKAFSLKPIPRCRALVVWRKHYMNYEADSSRQNVSQRRTICELLVELHKEAVVRGDVVTARTIERANDMAKRMQDRLKWYALKLKNADHSSLTIDDVGDMYWLSKKEYKETERRARKRKRGK